MSPRVAIRGIVFDLGDVLFTWSPNTSTTISAKTLRMILSTPTWLDYECGRLTQTACYEKIADEFRIKTTEVAEAFAKARESLQPHSLMVTFLKSLRESFFVSSYAMSNIGKEDFSALAGKMDWSLFDRVFASGTVGMRKPDCGFYQYVLQEIRLAPHQVVFVDDKQENVSAAERLGMRGVVFDDSTVDTLRSICDNPVARGYEYLYRYAKRFNSTTDSGVAVADNFAQLLILEVTKDPSLVDLEWETKETWNFFAGEATLVPGGYFPDDLDTTSLALTVIRPKKPDVIQSLLGKMLQYVQSDGTILTYFDQERPRTDAVVTANVLACFYSFGRGHELPHTLQHVYDVLLHRAYIDGTRYYPSPDCCLGFFERLLQSRREDLHLQDTLRPILTSRLKERVGQSGNALDLAMRILACDSLGIECRIDRQTLQCLQCKDGGWESGWMYRYGSTGVRIGNRGVTTALSVKALAFPVAFPTPPVAVVAAQNVENRNSSKDAML